MYDASIIDDIHAQLDKKQTRVFDDCLLLPISQVTEPVPRLSGIPNKSNIPPTITISTECYTSEGRKQLKNIVEVINVVDNEQWQRVVKASRNFEASINNVVYTSRGHGCGFLSADFCR